MAHSLDESIGFQTAQTHRALIRLITTHLRTYGITPEQWTVLKRLYQNGDLTQKQLSKVAEKDKATLTRILDLLAQKQLIERKQNAEDKRSFLVGITTKGSDLYKTIKPTTEELYRQTIVKGISEEELSIYINVLSQLKENSSQG
ncbi:DNA-binding MarR family transcriptional regulator [Alkalihalobacillus xiaoxiensis]|uniref:DNA-binding MarR family transcriptional regulator n=1 Tax=Shouchella xiaoxiensis TaxID=766895 RepID=A0ABS2SQR1_9BACI|nr:MarR family transcriptional regulator [Shouchella xiaoxiensis]MBM7837839.1 DNA-binding MarR family transcriptional regulator [Shouchella xiaoxiensis]